MLSTESCIVRTEIPDDALIITMTCTNAAGHVAMMLVRAGYQFAVKQYVREDMTCEVTISTDRQAAPLFHNV